MKRPGRQSGDARNGLGEMFKGLSDLIERLGELAEQGEELESSGSTDGASGTGRPLRAVYGFSVKLGGGQDGVKVEPFGHTRGAAQRGSRPASRREGGANERERAAHVHEVREPMVDMFTEDDGVHIIAEMPGVSAGDIELEIQEDILVLSAEQGDKKYRKELMLPRAYSRDSATISCNNGIVEIRLK